MRLLVTKSISAAVPFPLLLLSAVLVPLPGCTDLEETPTSAITPDNFFRTEEEVLGGLASVYAQLRSMLPGHGDYYNVIEVSSDEMIVPTRGSDWFDQGRWLELHRHTWAANSPSGLADMNGAWAAPYAGITRANVVLEALEKVTVADQAVVEAELRALRAFYYYLLNDLFGGVPIVETTEIEARSRNTRKEVFDFVEKELNEARQALPDRWDAPSHGRMTKGAIDAILASMYLNAGVFARDDGVSATAYNSCTAVQVGGQNACQAAIAAADRILNSGVYSLASTWRSNFTADNQQSPENILVAKLIAEDGLGMRILQTTLHYNQFTPSPWNGFSTLAETYYAFDQDDQRRQLSFLVGPQVNLETGQAVTDRPGNPLVFTPEIANAEQATEAEGARIGKWPHDPNHVGPDNGNDFAYFRLAEIYLIKAEALNELSPGSGQALQLLNTLRERVFAPDEDLGSIDRDVILRERLFELVFEAKRRQDQIRHGKFTQAWAFKGQSGAHRILMSIPQQQLDANPLLTQNPGY